MSQSCQRCYRIVARACQSDTESADCRELILARQGRRKPRPARCAVCFKGGGRCNRRSAPGSSWCEKHRPIMDKIQAEHVAMLNDELERGR